MFFKTKCIILILSILSFIGCNQKTKQPFRLSPTAKKGGCSSEGLGRSAEGALFKVAGYEVRASDLSAEMQNSIYSNNIDAYIKNKAIYEELALRIYLAKKLNILKDPKNPPALSQVLKLDDISEAEAKAFFEQNKHRMMPNVSFSQMRPQIVQFLKKNQIGATIKTEIQKMNAANAYTAFTTAPLAPKIELNLSGHPVKGSKDAKIQIIEISDYLCSHCQQANSKVKELVKRYKDKVSFTQVNFALRPNGLSGTYARGAFCAQKQGLDSFWKYHDLAFEKGAAPHDHSSGGHDHSADSKSPDSIATVNEVAVATGLNLEKFSNCLNSSEAFTFVRNTGLQMSQNGISGTPVFLVNNKKLAEGVHGLEEAIKSSL